jgi:outer membrane protein insertion porin family
MHRRFAAAILAAFIPLWLAFAADAPAWGQSPSDAAIVVVGNKHTDAAMIRAEFRSGADGRLDAAALDAALKRLYATNRFADVKIARDGDHIVVTVAENPLIDKLALEGNRKLKDEDLKGAVQSATGGPLSRALIHDDIERMQEIYRRHGYFNARVVPKTIAGKKDRVALVFEITEGDKLAVRQVAFAGNAAFTATKLKGVIKSGETNFLSFLLDNDAYEADRIENDRDLLRTFYRAHGYADVSVSASAAYNAQKKGVVLTFTIAEGPQYRFGTIVLKSQMPTVDVASLRPYLRTSQGDIYDADAVEKTVDDLTMRLAGRGEPFASVTARSERAAPVQGGGTARINLLYTVEPGRRLYIERIDIHGNTRTSDDVIRREFDVGEGDPYNRALVDRAERRLKALGYFKTVKIETHAGSAPDRIIVDVALEEQKTGNFNISGGYGSATGPEVSVSIGDRNLFGTGLVGKASITYGEYMRGGSISLTDPYVFDQHISLGGTLFANQTLASPYQSFDETVYGGRLTVGTPINDQLNVQWIYSLYNQGISLDPAAGPVSLPIQLAAAEGSMWVSSIGTSVTYSTLDNAKNPSSGFYGQFNTELAGLGGAVNFARTTDDVRYYQPIVGDVVGMVRAQGGYVTPWGGQQLPLIDNFFGGPQLVRGFAPDGFGPRDITPGTTDDNVGGNVYWATSAELQAPMPLVSPDAQLKVALFADTGSLWANSASSTSKLSSLSPSQEIANSQALRASVGASLIWDSPFGAIRVDYAYPVAKEPYDVTQRLNFTAGGF